ncbi:serine hydrolase [Methylobacterium oxalidis]|uniref:serine hydrolase n=1 Tax=Methylobacterium oxalidis TaxID=944322 RepID=UPI0033156B73
MGVRSEVVVSGLNGAEHQAASDNHSARGFRPTKIVSYLENGTLRYTSIWRRQHGNPWRALYGVSSARFRDALDRFAADGFRPVDLSVVFADKSPRFSAIWEQEAGLPWLVPLTRSSQEFADLSHDLRHKGYRLRCFSPYGEAGEESCASIWDLYAGPTWEVRSSMMLDEYENVLGSFAADGLRLVRTVSYNVGQGARYGAIWERSAGHPFVERHGIPLHLLQDEIAAERREGRHLVDLGVTCERENACTFTGIWEQREPPHGRQDGISDLVLPFMRKWSIPGLSLAIAQSGQIETVRAFGYANPITRETVTPETRFRVASVSKPITSTAVHILIERGRLDLGDHVLGEGAVLGTRFGTQPYGRWLREITVRHLLEHTAGGWSNDKHDPMFQRTDLSQSDLISWTLDNVPQDEAPGKRYAYSNFGYCLLGRVIEAASGLSYDAFVRRYVLDRCGAGRMSLARRSAAERHEAEAMYLGMFPAAPYELRVDRMDAHGGWLGSPSDVLNFLARVDPDLPSCDLLHVGSAADMLAPSSLRRASRGQVGYGRGWAVDERGNAWHDGRISGTQALMVRGEKGRHWCAACNAGVPGSSMPDEFHAMMQHVQAVKSSVRDDDTASYKVFREPAESRPVLAMA